MTIPQDHARAYRKLPSARKPAAGEMRSLRHEFLAIDQFNELRAEQHLTDAQAERLRAVIRAIVHGTDIPVYTEGGR